jgi:hypothetical protein
VRGIIDMLVGEIGGDDLAAFCVHADRSLNHDLRLPPVPCLSCNQSPAPRSFKPVLSTIRWRSLVPLWGLASTFSSRTRRLKVV